MKEGDRRALRSVQLQNMTRLRDLGLPTDLFSEGFWEREQEARKRELLLLRTFEAAWKSGYWDQLSLPFQDIIDRWKAEIASPMHFASVGPSPRWMPMLNLTEREWKRRNDGRMGQSWKAYKRKMLIKNRAAAGKPPPKFRT
jgi:hypothetical protein